MTPACLTLTKTDQKSSDVRSMYNRMTTKADEYVVHNFSNINKLFPLKWKCYF